MFTYTHTHTYIYIYIYIHVCTEMCTSLPRPDPQLRYIDNLADADGEVPTPPTSNVGGDGANGGGDGGEEPPPLAAKDQSSLEDNLDDSDKSEHKDEEGDRESKERGTKSGAPVDGESCDWNKPCARHRTRPVPPTPRKAVIVPVAATPATLAAVMASLTPVLPTPEAPPLTTPPLAAPASTTLTRTVTQTC